MIKVPLLLTYMIFVYVHQKLAETKTEQITPLGQFVERLQEIHNHGR